MRGAWCVLRVCGVVRVCVRACSRIAVIVSPIHDEEGWVSSSLPDELR